MGHLEPGTGGCGNCRRARGGGLLQALDPMKPINPMLPCWFDSGPGFLSLPLRFGTKRLRRLLGRAWPGLESERKTDRQEGRQADREGRKRLREKRERER